MYMFVGYVGSLAAASANEWLSRHTCGYHLHNLIKFDIQYLPSFLSQALDGFLIVLDKEANILYVSETILGHLGLFQVRIPNYFDYWSKKYY